MIRRALFALVAALALAVPATAQFSTRAQQEFAKGLTDDGYFGIPRYTTALLPPCATTPAKGKVAFDTTAGLFKVCDGSAWATVGANYPVSDETFKVCDNGDNTKCVEDELSGVTTGNTVVRAWGGTAAAPTFTLAAGTITAATFKLDSGTDYTLQAQPLSLRVLNAAENAWMPLTVLALGVDPSNHVKWGSTNAEGTWDLFLGREAAAFLQLGQDVNGAAVNQTIKAHDGITGTDISGAGLTLASGRGTGAAVSNPLTLNRQITKASGTTAQTYAPAVIHCPSKILSNTSATTTTVATITTTSTTGGNVTVDYGTLACSASTCDADGGIVKVAWNNNAGTVAAAMTAVALQADSDATGNITTGPTATVATNVVSIKATPVFTTIVPTTVWFTASYTVHSIGDTVVCQ